MPTIFPEDPEDEFDFETDWLEVIDDRSPASRTITRYAADAVLSGFVPANKERSCERFWLGFDFADEAAPYRLHREPPQSHPTRPWLYAEGVSFQSLAPSPNPEFDNKPQEAAVFSEQQVSRVARYAISLCTVRFRDIKNMRFLPDEQIDDWQDEWKRFVAFHTEPSIEALQADGSSQLIFAEGEPGTPPRTAFPAPIATLLSKQTFTLEWSVPHEYLSADPQVFLPTKLLNCVGKVNGELFLGIFEPGTLLMDPPRFEPFKYPVSSTDPYQPFIGWRVFIPLRRFDPEKGVPASAHRGHNLMPWRSDGKFYLATRDGTESGRRLIQGADFLRGIFQHHADDS